MVSGDDGKTRHGYRTEGKYHLDERRLVLRGGSLDGRTWTGVVEVGKRVFCGTEEWSRDGVYLVTAEVVDADGSPANVAVPAFAAKATGGS